MKSSSHLNSSRPNLGLASLSQRARRGRKSERRYMIHQIDKLWFKALGQVHRWTIRQGRAHCLRQKQRRFKRLMQAQNPQNN